jgi:aryl-alcohol dehydrogenase-like predicted oxidoreductase
MNFRRLGRTNLEVSEVGLGGGGIGQVWGYTTDSECLGTVQRAIELGVNFFDVAPIYGVGKAERFLGIAGRSYRKRLVYATKVMIGPNDVGDISKKATNSIKTSLKYLQTDYVDILQLHNWIKGDHDKDPEPNYGKALPTKHILGPNGVLKAFRSLRKEGKVKFLGLTGYGYHKAIEEIIKSNEFDTVQIHYNILHQQAAANFSAVNQRLESQIPPIIPLAKDHDLGIVAIRPYAAGALSSSIDRPISSDSQAAMDIKRASSLPFIVKGKIKTLSMAAIAFVLTNRDISTIVPGAKNVAEIEEAVSCINAYPLSSKDLIRIDKLYKDDFGI